jgi:hypothetical protein
MSNLETRYRKRKGRLLVAAIVCLALAAVPLGYWFAQEGVVLSIVTAPPAERTVYITRAHRIMGSIFAIAMVDETVHAMAGELWPTGRYRLIGRMEWRTTHTGAVGATDYYVDSRVLACLFAFSSILFFVGFWRTKPPKPNMCDVCGYDLRAHVAGQRCPECGTEIVRRG